MVKLNETMVATKNIRYILIAATILCICINVYGTYAQELDIINAQNILLENNPLLKAKSLDAERYKKRIPQVLAWDDPKLKIGINNVPVNDPSFSKSDMTSKEIGISQMIPFWGKLTYQEQIAALEYKKSAETLRLYTATLLHNVRTLFYEIAYLKDYQKILIETKKYLSLLLEIQKSRSASSVGTLSDVLKVGVELSKIDEEMIQIHNSIVQKQQMIGYLLGDSNREWNIAGEGVLSSVTIAPLSPDDLRDVLLRENPEIQLLSLQILMDEREVSLAKRQLYPDVEVGASYMQRDKTPDGEKRDDMFSVMATINIPVWFVSKNVPAIEEMKIKKGAAEALLDDKKNEILYAVNKLTTEIHTLHQLYVLYSNTILPQLEATLQADLSQYKTGSTEFMKLIDTIRMQLYYKKELLNSIKEYCINMSFIRLLNGDISVLAEGKQQ